MRDMSQRSDWDLGSHPSARAGLECPDLGWGPVPVRGVPFWDGRSHSSSCTGTGPSAGMGCPVAEWGTPNQRLYWDGGQHRLRDPGWQLSPALELDPALWVLSLVGDTEGTRGVSAHGVGSAGAAALWGTCLGCCSVWRGGQLMPGDSVVPQCSWSCFGGCLGALRGQPRAWQLHPPPLDGKSLAGGSGSSGDTAWLHLAVRPGLPLLPGQPLCFSSLAFWGRVPPRPEDLPSTPAHPEAPRARLEHRRRTGCLAGSGAAPADPAAPRPSPPARAAGLPDPGRVAQGPRCPQDLGAGSFPFLW